MCSVRVDDREETTGIRAQAYRMQQPPQLEDIELVFTHLITRWWLSHQTHPRCGLDHTGPPLISSYLQVMLNQVEALVDLCIKGLADPHPKVRLCSL
jgi:hypothetical protein